MRLLLLSWLLTLKRTLRDRAFLPVVLLLPVLLLLLGGYLSAGRPVAVLRAGVLFDPDDPVAALVYSALPQEDTMVFLPYTPGERAELERAVRTGALECAFLLEEPLTRAAQTGKLDGAVTLLRSPRSVADPILADLLFAAVLEAASPKMTENIVLEVFQAEPAALGEELRAGMDWHREQGEGHFMRQQASYLDGRSLEHAHDGPARMLHGLLALFLMAMTLFSLPRLIGDKTPGLWNRLGIRGRLLHYGGVWAALASLVLLAGTAGLLAIGLTFPQALAAPLYEGLALLAYALCLGALGVLVTLLLPKPGPLYPAVVFLLLLTAVLGGVLFDLREISLSLAALSRLFPTDWYLSFVLSGGGLAPLWGVTGMACGLSALRLCRHQT